MKRHTRTFLVLMLICALSISTLSAFAAFEDYPDGAGHWAEEYLRRAVDDGLMNGYDDGKLHPEQNIDCPQALAIICRVLDLQSSADLAKLGLSGKEWYAEYAVKAAAIGISFDSGLLKNSSMTRGEAFFLLADAFQLIPAEPDFSVLAGFKDAASLSGNIKDAFSALVSGGYVEGFAGYLNPGACVSRAEFITVLYRIVSGFTDGDAIPQVEGGLVISGNSYMSGNTFTGPIWFNGSASNVNLWNITAGNVVFRSQSSSLSVSGGSNIERLVIAGGNSDSMSIACYGKLGTVVIGDAAPDTVSLSGNIGRVEVTGSGNTINLNAMPDELVISGANCTINISSGYSAKNIRFTNKSAGNTVNTTAFIQNAELYGSSNALDTNGFVTTLTLGGSGCSVTGSGSADKLILNTARSSCDIKYGELVDNIDYGITDAHITLSLPATLAAGDTLSVSAEIDNPHERQCSAVWSVDGAVVKEEKVTIGSEPVMLTMTHNYIYTENMALSSTVSLKLTYTSAENETSTASADKELTLKNYGKDHYYNPTLALSTVTSGYAGNYTLKWAEEHDYTDAIKVAWINAKGYSSTSKYIIWVNLTYQRVNIFEGSAGKWQLIRSNIVGTGAPGSGTPVGVYTIFGRSPYGWTTSTYNVRPVVNFKTGSGYAFHSRLYDPAHTHLTSTAIGYPISHGCVRMYDEDVQWIYDNVPTGTTVVVF